MEMCTYGGYNLVTAPFYDNLHKYYELFMSE